MTQSKQEWPRFEPEKKFYEHVARGYDITAPSYDDVEGRNEISERVRRISLAAALAASLRPGAKAVLTAANRISLFELLVYPAVGRPRKAFRKLGQNVPIPVSREGAGKRYVVPTRFLSPREFLSALGADFDVESWRGLQVLTPPWNLVDMARLFRLAVAPLEVLEDHFGQMRGFRSLGSIFLMTLRRRV